MYYPMVGVLTFPQSALNTNNTPYDLPVVRQHTTPCSISGQNEPSSQIKSEVKDEIADQDCRFASETQCVDSSMEDNVKSEMGFTNLQTNVSNDGIRITYPCS